MIATAINSIPGQSQITLEEATEENIDLVKRLNQVPSFKTTHYFLTHIDIYPSMSKLRFAKFEPFKSVLFYLRTFNRINAFCTSTVNAIFGFIRIYSRINAYSLVIICFCP
jgi:hypothetical protein